VNTAPDYIEPVVGWRLWYAGRETDDGPVRLSSVFHKTTWPVGRPLVACCRCLRLWPFNRKQHEAPGERCRCGIYAANISTVRFYLPDRPPIPAVPVIGRVRLWGVVHEYEQGWRAGFAYPECLFVPLFGIDRVRAAAVVRDLRDYRVPVTTVGGADADGAIAEVRALAAAA
jgi:hypothetical protein